MKFRKALKEEQEKEQGQSLLSKIDEIDIERKEVKNDARISAFASMTFNEFKELTAAQKNIRIFKTLKALCRQTDDAE